MDENCYVEPISKTTSLDQFKNAEVATLAVSGMGCENCVTRVRNSLLELEGVYFLSKWIIADNSLNMS